MVMGSIEETVSYWNSAMSPRQMGFCVEWRLAESAHLGVLEREGWEKNRGGGCKRKEDRGGGSHTREKRVKSRVEWESKQDSKQESARGE